MTKPGWTHAHCAKQTAKAIDLLATGASYASVAAATGYTVGHVKSNITRNGGGRYDGLRARKDRAAIPRALVEQYHAIVYKTKMPSAKAAQIVLRSNPGNPK